MLNNKFVASIMSKMQCKCGHVISDVVCPCATEADVIGDTAYEHFDRDFTRDVADFLAATRKNRRSDWIVEHFGKIYPSDLPDAEIISDLLTANFRKYAVSIAECENVGDSGSNDKLKRITTGRLRPMKADTNRILRSSVRPMVNSVSPETRRTSRCTGAAKAGGLRMDNQSSPPRDR